MNVTSYIYFHEDQTLPMDGMSLKLRFPRQLHHTHAKHCPIYISEGSYIFEDTALCLSLKDSNAGLR